MTANVSVRDILKKLSTSNTEVGYIRSVVAGTATASKALVLGTSKDIDTLDISAFKSSGASAPTSISWSYSAGASNVTNVTATFKDGGGSTVSDVQTAILYLSDDSGGDGITATSSSGAVTVTTGTQLSVLTAKKALMCVTDANGQLVFSITDTAKTAFYPVTIRPLTGRVDVGTAIQTADYG